ncbi:conserved hypothetical protein [Microcystis aeruginosa NIES-298]|uniref:Uncharacterized protein n=2 Tax=Microcystis aeruginosa TaxID=1126 RepID=A0A2H6BTC6_MICAE|nr:hypothetical protein BGM30_25330 [Microcystis aeruginosa NIES-298]GBE96183.1 conserved hypothetical protein [Microcystis aeruginosa NIES-298]
MTNYAYPNQEVNFVLLLTMSNNNSERVVRRGRVFPEIQSTEEAKAKHRARQLEFYHRCWPIFQSLQPRLMKHYYGWYIAIKPDSGDYFIDPDQEVASKKARAKYPDKIHHIFGINETGVSGRI